MGAKSSKFIPRAPRYKLRPLDNKFLRFAHQDAFGRSFTTQFIDISTSGVSFITDIEFAPTIGEQIKLEIPLDGEEKVAWFGQVMRIEKYSSTKWWLNSDLFHNDNIVFVGVAFQDLPEGHRQRIRQTLRRKFLEIQKEKNIQTFKNFVTYASHHTAKTIFYAACFLATLWILWTLSQPSANYDPKKGSPWMQRYPQLNFFDKDYNP